MNKLVELASSLTSTSALFPLKLMLAGIGALVAGMLCMVSGIDGFVLRGGLIVACGVGLLGISYWSLCQHVRQPEESPVLERQVEEGGLEERPVALSTCDHDWVNPDEMLNFDSLVVRCIKCGEVRGAWG